MGKAEITIRTLWGIAKSAELKLTDEELHLIVEQQTGKDSIKNLTPRELSRVYSRLCDLKYSAKKGQRGRQWASGGNEATANQRRKLWKLAEQAGWNNSRVNGLCRKMFRVDAVERLNYMQCSDLTEAVKAIIARERKVEKDGKGSKDI